MVVDKLREQREKAVMTESRSVMMRRKLSFVEEKVDLKDIRIAAGGEEEEYLGFFMEADPVDGIIEKRRLLIVLQAKD